MSIVIKGMTSPKSCAYCVHMDLCTPIGCSHSYDMINEWEGKSVNCPIIEIPDHGDLIDRDELLKMDPWDWGCDPYEVGGVKQTIEEQLVIIPAERSKDET